MIKKIVFYEWDLNNDGDYKDATGMITTCCYPEPGYHRVSLRVWDDEGLNGTKTKKICVGIEITNVKGGFGIKATVNNPDGGTIQWSIIITGIMLFGSEKHGTLNGTTGEIKTGFILGIGGIEFTVNAGYASKNYDALILGPFVFKIKEK